MVRGAKGASAPVHSLPSALLPDWVPPNTAFTCHLRTCSLLKQISGTSQLSVALPGQDLGWLSFNFAKQGHCLKKLVTIYCHHDFTNEDILAPKWGKDIFHSMKQSFPVTWLSFVGNLFLLLFIPDQPLRRAGLLHQAQVPPGSRGPFGGLCLTFPVSHQPISLPHPSQPSQSLGLQLITPVPHTSLPLEACSKGVQIAIFHRFSFILCYHFISLLPSSPSLPGFLNVSCGESR